MIDDIVTANDIQRRSKIDVTNLSNDALIQKDEMWSKKNLCWFFATSIAATKSGTMKYREIRRKRERNETYRGSYKAIVWGIGIDGRGQERERVEESGRER